MSGHSPQTSRLLTVIAVFLCICMSGIFTRSSALPSQISPSSDAETLVSEEISLTVTPVDIPQTTPTPSPKVTKAASKNKSKKSFKVSPEASEGNWTSSGSNWMFLVDGNAYTGWLTDTDGKRYYFDRKRDHADRLGRCRWKTILYGSGRHYADRRYHDWQKVLSSQ